MEIEEVRHFQISCLRNVFGTKKGKARSNRVLPPCLFLWGPRNTGKTFILEKCIKDSHIKSLANINCLEIICGRKGLFQSILRQLRNSDQNRMYQRCETLLDFISQLRSIFGQGQERDPIGKPTVIIVDQAQFLRGDNNDVLLAFSRLQELTDGNICVVLISRLPWRSYCHATECIPPVQLHFPQYKEEEVMTIICSQPPPEASIQVFQYYVKMILGVYYLACRDLKKLWKLVQLRQNEFLEPCQAKGKELTNLSDKILHGLWKNIQPALKHDFEKFSSFRIRGSSDSSLPATPLISTYLTIAAFIASVNPPSSDRRFFVRSRNTQKRTELSTRIGSKTFHHSRFLAIFSRISEAKFRLDTGVLFAIESLCSLGYLSQLNKDDFLSEPRYRCHVSQEIVKNLCRTVNFDLDRALFSRL